MIPAGAPAANLTKIAEVETAITPITTAIYGLNGGKRKCIFSFVHCLDCNNNYYSLLCGFSQERTL